MIATPAAAPARRDLDWLRHRSRRRPEPAAPSTTAGSGGLADFLSGRTTRRQSEPAPTPSPIDAQRPAPTPAPAGDVDLGTSAADPLDLSGPPPTRPAPPPAPAPQPPPSGDLLDLSVPTPQPTSPHTPTPAVSGDLDLSSSDRTLSTPPPAASTSLPRPASSDLDLFPEASAPAAPQAAAARTPAPRSPASRTSARPPRPESTVRPVPRVPPGGRVILSPREPTVTLDRVQSGIGVLTVTAVCSPAVGDLVLGVVHQLADCSSGVVSRTAGIPTAPPRSRRPVLEASRGEFDQIRVDLRQSRSLRRFVVYAVSASESSLAWGGTLRITTHGGSRVEIPLDLAPHDGPVVVASVYAVDGELVVRAELDPLPGLVRDVAQAYGFRAITWADARTPVL